ncbi:hypothetical protein IK146_02625 [Candidatus Saccharibacteria bacterium]|nr:hypothetical protein [Candidatus Saccharibacteria bacterium]
MRDKRDNKKKVIVSALTLCILGGVGLTGEVSAWGPERDTYTNENPAPQAVFNSITNNVAVGDERDFVRIVEIRNDGQKDDYTSDLTIRAGHDYEVYIYYHNNASATYNAVEYGYKGVARNVRVSATFPQSLKAGETGTVAAILSAERTLVDEVWDEANITAEEDVTLAYIADSAKLYNLGRANGTVLLADDLFTDTGALLGYNTLNGVVYGCDEYSGHIVFQIRATAVVEPSSTFEIDKKISIDNGATWLDDAEMKPGQEAEFRITYKNTGTLAQDVTAFDTLESGQGMEYVIGSTRIVANGTEQIIHDENGGGLFDGGVEIGRIQPGEVAEIYYKIKLDEATKFECGKTVLYNLAGVSSKAVGGNDEAAGVATSHDKVKIEVTRDDSGCLPTELPSTGPAEIVLSGVILAGLAVGIFYYVNSQRTLKRLENEAKGEGYNLDKPEQM